jgi:hypothetical protein
MTEQQKETVGQLIDRLDNLKAGFEIPLPPSMHIEQGSIVLDEVSKELKLWFLEVTGENPWD